MQNENENKNNNKLLRSKQQKQKQIDKLYKRMSSFPLEANK